MSSPPSLVWFLLLDSVSGEPYKGVSASKVSTEASADIDDFRDAVKAKYSNKLSSFDGPELLVYNNKSIFDKRNANVDEGKEEPLEEDSFINCHGASKKEALIITIPPSAGNKEERARKKARPLATFEVERISSIAHTSDIDAANIENPIV
jgi:hypothetical protein